MPIAVLIGANFSVEGVAIGMTITNIIYFFPMWRFLISPLLKVDFKEYLKAHIFSFTNLNDILNGLIKK